MTDVAFFNGRRKLRDDVPLTFGDDNDATILYDGFDLIIDPAVVGLGNLHILSEVGINMDAMEKHTLAIGDPTSFESGSSYIDVFSTAAKIQSRTPDANGLVGCLLDITTQDVDVDVSSPGFALLKGRATNEQDVSTGIGTLPFMGLDFILTNNGNMQGQPSGSGWSDTACNFKTVQNGTDQQMANFSFHSGRGVNGEVICNYEVTAGTPIVVQVGADCFVDMTNYAESGTGAAVVLNQVGVQGRAFGTTVGVGSTSIGGQFSATGGATNIGINVAAGESRFAGDIKHTGTNLGFYSAAATPQSAAYTPTNVTPDRAYDANATTTAELADVLGTLIADLQLTGLIG